MRTLAIVSTAALVGRVARDVRLRVVRGRVERTVDVTLGNVPG